MAKTKLGNVKGPKGDQGVRGSKWYNTDKITGESTSGTAFPQSGIADAMPGDMALNPTTLNLYICREGGAAASAKWAYLSCIKGPQGERGPKGEPTTVDAALSESSTNPIQNKIVSSNFKDVRDSLSRIKFGEGVKGVEFAFNEGDRRQPQIHFTGMPLHIWFDPKRGIGLWDEELKKSYVCHFDEK